MYFIGCSIIIYCGWFDINENRINELNKGIDTTLEVSNEYLTETLNNNLFSITADKTKIADCTIYIVTVPTPTDKNNRPLLIPLIKASETVASVLKKGDIVQVEVCGYNIPFKGLGLKVKILDKKFSDKFDSANIDAENLFSLAQTVSKKYQV